MAATLTPGQAVTFTTGPNDKLVTHAGKYLGTDAGRRGDWYRVEDTNRIVFKVRPARVVAA